MAVALAAGGLKGDASTTDRGWFDSTYAVEVPLANASGGGGTFELDEGSRIELLLRRSLPGARLRRLVRLQDRARMLRFVCERDAAISSAAAANITTASTGGTSPSTSPSTRQASISRLFADPRDVVARDTLAAIAAPGSAVTTGAGAGKAGHGWTVGSTLAPDHNNDYDNDNNNTQTRGLGSATTSNAVSLDNIVRCAETAQFAAVGFAPPPTEPGGEGAGGSSNLRTLAIVRAIIGVPRERGGPDGRETRAGGSSGSAAGSTVSASSTWPLSAAAVPAPPAGATGAAAAGGERHDDPFLGVDCRVDDLTRVGGIGLSSPPPMPSLVADDGDDGGGGGSGGLRLQSAPGLSSPHVHSIKTLEVVGGAHGETSVTRRWRSVGSGSGSGSGMETPVYTLRREACYPEYLATFSL